MQPRESEPVLDLSGSWRMAMAPTERAGLEAVRSIGEIEATGLPILDTVVPGNLELDLLANGLIEDPFRGMNIAGLTRYEQYRVVYFRRFTMPAIDNGVPILEADGIDCYATIILNGRVVGKCDNMLVEHRFELSQADLRRENEIIVVIDPPLGRRPDGGCPRLLQAMAANYESLYTRKAPHGYGWDIMPRALSAGIWKPIRILLVPHERIMEAYLETLSIADDRASASLHLHVCAKLDRHPHSGYALLLEGKCGDSAFSYRMHLLGEVGAGRFVVESPRLWWPRGRGEPCLYRCRLALTWRGAELDAITFNHGIRTVELERTDVTDEAGRGEFCFHVNGERFFALGTNWVPLDAYHSRDIARVDRALELVEDIGCNMIRCWGGNVYESDRFFDLCDKAGILVWQDFAMACAVYPQDVEFQEALRREAVKVVRRLRQHPSVALWAGDNECDASFLWGSSGIDPNTNVLTRQVLPEALRNEDPRRPFLPSSPYISPAAYRKGVRYLPEVHLWGPRDDFKGGYYRGSLCHFASEIGYHGCPDPRSLREFLSEGCLWPYWDNPEWLLHATSPVPGVDLFDYRIELMAAQVRLLFGAVPDNLDDFAYASQCSQAEAMKFFIEMFRSAKWRKTGIIWWNILDGWPQFSDAVVDYYFRRKRAYATIRRSQAPVCMTLREPEDELQELVVCNDTRERVQLRFTVTDAETGAVLLTGAEDAGGDVVTVVGEVPYDPALRRLLLIEWSGPSCGGWNYYLAGERPFDLAWYRGIMDRLDARPTDAQRRTSNA